MLHFNNDYINPIYNRLFEIYYISNDISSFEKKILRDNTKKIKYKTIYMNIYSTDKGIPVLSALSKLNTFDIKLVIKSTDNDILGYFYYEKCSFDNLYENVINFSYEQLDDILEPTLKINCEKISYINVEDTKSYLRKEKLKNILNF